MRRTLFFVCGVVLSALVGCGSDSDGNTGSGGAGNGGASGTAGAGGSTGGSSAGGGAGAAGSSKAGSSGATSGAGQVTCNQPGIKACTIYVTMNVAQTTKDCSGSDWSVVDHCPSAGLIGCCVTGLGTSCIYDGVDPTIAMLKQNNCQPPNGTWTTTPP